VTLKNEPQHLYKEVAVDYPNSSFFVTLGYPDSGTPDLPAQPQPEPIVGPRSAKTVLSYPTIAAPLETAYKIIIKPQFLSKLVPIDYSGSVYYEKFKCQDFGMFDAAKTRPRQVIKSKRGTDRCRAAAICKT
jgi:hypothetical protein